MSVDNKISLLEECMDIQTGLLRLDYVLSDYEEWDSLTALSLIAMASERNHQIITGEELKKAKTVSDVVKLIN